MEIPPNETEISLISVGSQIEGKVFFQKMVRIYGSVQGEVIGMPKSHLVFKESSSVEGAISGDTITVEGFVRGTITASQRIHIKPSARIFGELQAPIVKIEPGAFVEGRVQAAKLTASLAADTISP